jgi:hypothetical protein
MLLVQDGSKGDHTTFTVRTYILEKPLNLASAQLAFNCPKVIFSDLVVVIHYILS